MSSQNNQLLDKYSKFDVNVIRFCTFVDIYKNKFINDEPESWGSEGDYLIIADVIKELNDKIKEHEMKKFIIHSIFKNRFGQKTIDKSVKNKLKILRKEMIKEHGEDFSLSINDIYKIEKEINNFYKEINNFLVI